MSAPFWLLFFSAVVFLLGLCDYFQTLIAYPVGWDHDEEAEPPPMDARTCIRCGTPFYSRNPRQQYCTDRCANRAKQQRHRERHA